VTVVQEGASRASSESLWKAQVQSRKLRAELDLSDPNQLRVEPVPRGVRRSTAFRRAGSARAAEEQQGGALA
jgi:hypothetical protein